MIIFQAILLKTWLQKNNWPLFTSIPLNIQDLGWSLGQLDALNEADLSMTMAVQHKAPQALWDVAQGF